MCLQTFWCILFLVNRAVFWEIVWITCKVQIHLPWSPTHITHKPTIQKRARKLRGSGEVRGWHKLLGDAVRVKVSVLSVSDSPLPLFLVFLLVLAMLAEELYLASEMLHFKHKSKPPCTCHHPKAPQGYAHGSNETMSFAELGLKNLHCYGLLSLVMNIRCFYQIINPFLCWFFQLKM